MKRVLTTLAGCGLAMLATAIEEPSPQAISPDGRYVATADVDDTGGMLTILDRQSGKVRTTLRLGGRKSLPVFSPDGYFIAFYVQFRDDLVLTVTDLTGHSWPVATVRAAAGPPAWSANAEHVFFSNRTVHGDLDIFRVTAGGTHLVNLTQTPDRDERDASLQDPVF